MPWGPFYEQRVYNRRRDVHAVYGGQQQGGICTPSQHPVIIVFTGSSGEQHGYADGWSSEGVFRYFGEGQLGDMVFERGNRAIRDHLVDGKDLLVFQTRGREGVRFLGQFECAGYSLETAPDRNGAQRSAIVFELVPANVGEQVKEEQLVEELELDVDLAGLRARALEAAQLTPQVAGTAARRSLYRRSAAVRRYVLARAAGICESCNEPAPFVTLQGKPYLEPHHTRRLSDGGPDDPRFVGAVCPSCHREIHHGLHGPARNEALIQAINQKEALARR
ncbi:HNH endonuclease [Methylobacterium sp. WL103]|uniref:HNH endonuclease n=1 Tax=Methylobacterium sp. WL103 TaxID=2603891 RepID=UPI0011CBC938|nr:HNH endonuclease [Methylobacterium sp. WL103]TXN01386.1 HNH endonuclease [Methylobacterium sp. WL103]